MGIEDKKLGTINLSGPSFSLDIFNALSKPENETSIFPPEVIVEKSSVQENENDIIARKQAWFDRPGLVSIAQQFGGKELTIAMGVKNYDGQHIDKIAEQREIHRDAYGPDMGAETLGKLNAIHTANAQFGYKRTMVFIEALYLSKVPDKIEQDFNRKMQSVSRDDPIAITELTRHHPAVISMGEGMGWSKILEDSQRRETVFNYVKKYDLVAPFYFLLNSKTTYAPKGVAIVFKEWCLDNNIDLRQALLDYETIDMGGPEPSKRVDTPKKLPKRRKKGKSAIESLPKPDSEAVQTFDEPEHAALIIARKQAWFDRPGLSFLVDKLEDKKLNTFMGIENHDVQQIQKISEAIKLVSKTGTAPKELEELNALDAATDVLFEYKRAMMIMKMIKLSKVPIKAQEEFDKKLRKIVRKEDSRAVLTNGQKITEEHPKVKPLLQNDPVMTHKAGGAAWSDLMRDNEMRTTLFGHIKNYDLIAPFYFLINSKNTYAPEGIAEVFKQWCQDNSINLQQELLDYELIDIGGPKPLQIKISDIVPSTPKPKKNKSVLTQPLPKPITEEAITLEGTVIKRIFREAEKSHPNNSAEREDDIARMKWLSEHLQAFASLETMNAKFEPHAKLADVLFSDNVMRALETSHLLPNGKKKIPVVSTAIRDDLAQRLSEVFAITGDNEDIRPDDLERNEKLKECILKFPGLIIAGLTIDQSLKQIRDKYNIPLLSDIPPYAERNPAKRAKLEFDHNQNARTLLLTIAGIELPVIEFEEPQIPEAAVDQEAQEDSVDALPIEELLETNEPPEDHATDESKENWDFEEVIVENNSTEGLDDNKPANDLAETTQNEDDVEFAEVFSGAAEMFDLATIEAAATTPLSDEEKLCLMAELEDAFVKTKERLLAEAQMYLMQAQNKQCDQFNCFIDVNKPGFAINLRFFGEVDFEGEQRTRKASYVLDNYDDAFRKIGIPLTPEKAVDLKIAVQSLILNTEGIYPTRNLTTKRNTAVARDTQMPLPINKPSIVKDGTGMCALVYEAPDPYNKGKIVSPRIPLGFAMRYEDEDAEQKELDERAEYVLNYLEEIQSCKPAEARGVYVFKRDVIVKLQSFLKLKNKEWETAERIALPGFEEPTLVHVFAQSAQKITLAPISLARDVGGENPSWHCGLSFYVGDQNEKKMGQCVRTRSLYLRTRNQKLAIARTLESLNGYKNISTGLLPALQEHMQKTEDEWRVESGDKGDEVFIGSTKLQDFLDDMLLYERDIGVKLKKRETIANGNVVITLQALRCLKSDLGGTVTPKPEYVYEGENMARKPIAFSLIVPKSKIGVIDDFVEDVHGNVNWFAEEAYSSLAFEIDGQTAKRKSPTEYRTSQIRNLLIRAVEAIYEEKFGCKLPQKWHAPEIQNALTAESSPENASAPEAALS